MTSLERIEERHKQYQRLASSPAVAVHEDVVKLARALAQFVRAVKYTSGVSLEFAASEAERVLAEVAGGDDDRR